MILRRFKKVILPTKENKQFNKVEKPIVMEEDK
jgi:hypothetical protein